MSSRLVDKQVLIIDDDEVLRTLLARVLSTAGCKTESCASVKDALKKLNSWTPDLIFLDLNMDEHDGFSFLKFRRQNNVLAAIPVIVLSGTKKKDDIQKAMELGANQFLEKPFEARIILQKIRYIFLTQEDLSYRFPEEEQLAVEAEIQAEVVAQCTGYLKISSQVRFAAGKSLHISAKDYVKRGGTTLIGKIESRLTELKDGFFRTIIKPVGLSAKDKKQLDNWQRKSSK